MIRRNPTILTGGRWSIWSGAHWIFGPACPDITYSWTKLILGGQLFGGVYSNFFNGSIDEIRISDIVRSATDISNYFNTNQPFNTDSHTIGLWHFDQNSGTSVTGTAGGNGTTNATWTSGIFGNALQYNGTSNHTDFNFTTPATNSTIEFWIKPNTVSQSWTVMTYGANSGGVLLIPYTTDVIYTWSTGATGNYFGIDPSRVPYIWVTDGSCTDTIFFTSQSATISHINYITVTDTLLINTAFTGINPPNNNNTIKIYPNPASDHVTIDYGNYPLMNGYLLKITNSLGQQVFQTSINLQNSYLNLATWGGNGIYFVHIIDPDGNTIDIRKIVLRQK